jgi:chromosome segregation ATPase
MADPVDEAAELLYGLPLDEFTTARNAAAKELRDRGLRDEAEAVKAFAKPSVAAWAVNQLTRRRHAGLDEFLDAAVAAREAQLGGKPEAREAIKHQRDALEKLVRAAREELGGKASEAVTGKIRQTLEAAAVDDRAAEDVRKGRLAKELEPAGFGTLAAHAPPPGKERPRPAKNAAAGKKALAEARARLREAEDELRAAQAEERQAYKRWQQAQGDAEDAATRVEKIRTELEQLRSG